jgi:hypothetical protein
VHAMSEMLRNRRQRRFALRAWDSPVNISIGIRQLVLRVPALLCLNGEV